MTDEQILQFVDDMRKYFGKVPNPEHCPTEFAYYVKMYSYIKGISNDNNSV